MNKLRLLKKLNNEGLFECLTGEELHLFLLMIAGCNEHGEGEILSGQIRWIFGKNFPSERLNDICGQLEKKQLLLIISLHRHCAKRRGLVVAYRILFPGQAGQDDAQSEIWQ